MHSLSALAALLLFLKAALPLAAGSSEGGASAEAIIPMLPEGVISAPLAADSAGEGTVALSLFQFDAGSSDKPDDPSLAVLIPRLMLDGMQSLPSRASLPAGRILRLHPSSADGRFLEASVREAGRNAATEGADFVISGSYARKGTMTILRIAGFSTITESLPLEWEGEGDGGDLRPLIADALPTILSWAAGRALGWIDISAKPAGAIVEVDGKPLPSGSARWYSEDSGEHVLNVSKPGFTPIVRRIRLDRPGGSRLDLALEPLPAVLGGNAAATGERGALVSAPGWESAAAYPGLNDGFRASLGLFALSIPLAVIAAGYNTLYKEAYIRNVGFSDAYSASNVAMGAVFAACAALAVNAGLRFVQYLSSTR